MERLPEPFAALVREHRLLVDGLGETVAAIANAATDPSAVAAALASIERARKLLRENLLPHAEEEEREVFVALRAADPIAALVVDEMCIQHEEIASRHAWFEEWLAALPGAAMGEGSKRAAMLVQGLRVHFEEEEETLFTPFAARLAPAVLAHLAGAVAAVTRTAAPIGG